MRRRYRIWSVCLLAWIIGLSSVAVAQGRYDELCQKYSVRQSETTAWIEIDGTDFLQPVMQHKTDDGFYAGHDAAGEETAYGSLYTQSSYNAADFSDPVTVIYGSSKAEGAPLRDMQEMYSGRFDELRNISLHLPDKTLKYEVFAAVPYSSIHILHYFDFKIERRYEKFIDDIYSTRMLGMQLDAENRPKYDDKVMILSTGMRGDKMQRYLVLAKLSE